MTEAEEREKAEKLAAAKKRFEQLRKQKGKKAGTKKKEDEDTKPDAEASTAGEKGEDVKEAEGTGPDAGVEAPETATDEADGEQEKSAPTSHGRGSHARQPSLSVQSQMRSSSFRRSSLSANEALNSTNLKSPTLPPLSPEGDTITDIYRKQAARVEELERENRKLAKEVKDWEEREDKWMQKEEELEELGVVKSEAGTWKQRAEKFEAENVKLKNEIATLQRQISHLQAQTGRARHSTSPSQAHISLTTPSNLESALQAKESTIESMEMEISRLRADLSVHSSGSEAHLEQVKALEEKAKRAESAAGAAQRELQDLKKNLERASERAVKEGSQRSSAETKIHTMEKEVETSNKITLELKKKVEALEKKITTLTILHKDSDVRSQENARQRTRLENEAKETKARLATLENENLRLREAAERRKKAEASGVDDDGVDELEDEERRRLEARIRTLEGELFEAHRKGWREQKQALLQQGDEARSPDRQFQEVDLSGGSPVGVAGRVQNSFTNVLSGGLNALTGGASAPPVRQSLDLNDDDVFDEEAFRIAQEEEARKRVERAKEAKRSLMNWEGWRLDLVEHRAGGGGIGEIFEI